MDDLLPELNRLIFKNLSINDLFSSRLVSKKFKYYSDNHSQVDRLFVGDYASFYVWPFSKELIEENDSISLECFNRLQSRSLFNLNSNLKLLMINQMNDGFNFKILSNLINLEILDVFAVRFVNNQSIDFTNLKLLVLASSQNGFRFNLNTPRLEKICSDLSNFNFMNSESIKYIRTIKYEDKLRMFKNLEIMVLDLGENVYLDSNLLSIFKNLKELRINANYDLIDLYRRLKNNLIIILQESIDSNRNIDLYMQAVKISNMNKFKEIDNYKDQAEFQIKNINLIDFNETEYLNYNDLEIFFKDLKKDLPSSFLESNLTEIYVTEALKNNDNFIWFLRSHKNVKYLKIFTKLDQYVYDNLPDTIQKLEFKKSQYQSILGSANDDQNLFSLAFKLFSSLKSLNKFYFHYRTKRIEITKENEHFCLRIASKLIEKQINYNRLVELCRKFKLDHDRKFSMPFNPNLLSFHLNQLRF